MVIVGGHCAESLWRGICFAMIDIKKQEDLSGEASIIQCQRMRFAARFIIPDAINTNAYFIMLCKRYTLISSP